eukprot:1568314-Amphidinium_carterae.1
MVASLARSTSPAPPSTECSARRDTSGTQKPVEAPEVRCACYHKGGLCQSRGWELVQQIFMQGFFRSYLPAPSAPIELTLWLLFKGVFD